MSPSENREEALFEAALQIPGEQRRDFLAKACADDAELRNRIEGLLKAFDRAGGFLENSAVPSSSRDKIISALPGERFGDRIGRYKLLEQIGEGGCGVVYVAEQEAPVRRRVALKIIKLGMDTKSVIARFDAERQALAMMDHPNIAKVFDASATETGRPYFVMELVRGVKITDYCNQNSLAPRARLELFIQVCRAIQHAHQKGIIHRDIKPSNILVTLHDGTPVPKVIDFGIAKATQGRLTDQTVYTAFEQFIGTPAYMSPEQAEMSGFDIDTRSDIYSLGVLLYELLTGKTPFDAKELLAAGLDEIRRTIREVEPIKPSTRITQDLTANDVKNISPPSENQRKASREFFHEVRGDLDWIVMKCLEKDRTRRYETATGLASDIERHLGNEPILAHPPTRRYRLQKSIQRNKLVFAAGTAVVLALAIGFAGMTWLFFKEQSARERAVLAERQHNRLRIAAENARSGENIARQKAERESKRAEADELTARRIAYASDMNLVQQALADKNLGRANELLNRYRFQPPDLAAPHQSDLRGWEWRYLWQQCQSDAIFTLCHKSTEIDSLSVSFDGKWLAVGEHDKGGLSIWDLQTRKEVAQLEAGTGLVLTDFSPHEPLLAFSVADETIQNRRDRVRLWDGSSQKIVAELQLGGAARGVKFSDDGQTLITSSFGDDQIVLWRVSDGKLLASIPAPQINDDDGTLFAVTHSMKMAAHALPNGGIRVVDLSNGKELWTAAAVDRHATALQFSPDEGMLATGSGFTDSSVRLLDTASGQEIARLSGHRGYVLSFVFWPDGKTLASASSDQTICLWDLNDPAHVPPPRVLQGHKREVWRLALLPDNSTLISGSQDGTVNCWNTQAGIRRVEHFTLPDNFSDGLLEWQFAPDSQSIISVDEHGIRRWAGPEYQQKERVLEFGIKAKHARVSPDCGLAAVGSEEGVVHVWDLKHGSIQFELATKTGSVVPWQFLKENQSLLLYQTDTGNFYERDLKAQQDPRLISRIPSRLWAWSSGNDRYFFAGSGEYPIILADTHANPIIQRALEIEQGSAAAISPDGKLVAAVSRAGYARLWNTTDFKEMATFRNFLQGVHGLVFSADNRRLLTASDGREAIKIWDVESFQELLTLPAEGAQFHRLVRSPDGNIFIAWGEKGLNLWRAPSWEEIAAKDPQERASAEQP